MYKAFTLGDKTTTPAVGTAVDVGGLTEIGVSVSGTFVATLKLMVTYDGTEYIQHGADITGPIEVTDIKRVRKIRLDLSAWTSGTAKGRGGGDSGR